MNSFEEYFAQSLVKAEEVRLEVKETSDSIQQQYSWNVEKDLRIRVFEQINNLMQPYSLTLLYGEKCISDDAWVSKMLNPMSQQDVEGVRNTYEVFIRNAFIFNFASVVESCMRSFLRAVCPKNKAVGEFRKVKSALFEALENNQPDNSESALRLLNAIRNCIHNNGVHYSPSGDTLEIEYRNENYIFQEGALQTAAKLETLLLLLKDINEMFVFIVTHPKVTSLELVHDDGT